jgi:5-oxopent-3-ene-1,2,5-tricarboxylate decarboxylase/2-hydroxyhepta-2,4-diene-1,7-dioate isomerase
VKVARVQFESEVLEVVVRDDTSLEAADGRTFSEEQITWMPPDHGTIICLGLNYADHIKELELKTPAEPLMFIKSPSSVNAHKGVCCRPDDVEYMHYENELVAVIGKTAHKIKREEAMNYLRGYTICNEFAIRDYLENYYRPNLRVKSRDSLTPIGPYVIDAEDVGEPSDLAIKTYVNGELRQDGSTRDMIFDIPYLISYISAFMTLQPGDMISTGTPFGVSDVVPGDVMVCEIEKVGRLENTMVSESQYYGS